MAGVDIDLIVRDICRLRPGLDGLSDNISVHSVVGRFLEHSRIFYFENGARADDPGAVDTGTDGGRPEYYIGSADWMTRNLDHRVEAVTPVEDPTIRRQLKFNLELILADNEQRWTMNPDGSYDRQRPDGEPTVATQETLIQVTLASLDADDPSECFSAEFSAESDIFVGTPEQDQSGGEQPPDRQET
jgi:polyphosphate kinase